MSNLLLWVIYALVFIAVIAIFYKMMNPEDKTSIMAKLGKIIISDWDDEDEVYETE
jgi:hypothetical protein